MNSNIIFILLCVMIVGGAVIRGRLQKECATCKADCIECKCAERMFNIVCMGRLNATSGCARHVLGNSWCTVAIQINFMIDQKACLILVNSTAEVNK